MPRRTEYRSTSPHPADDVWAVMVDAEYLRTRLAQIGGPGAALLDHSADADGARFTVRQGLDAELLPQMVRNLVPGDLVIERTEVWRKQAPGSYQGDARVVVPGTPASAVGGMRLRDTADGSEFEVRTEVSVKVPLVGGRMETAVAEQVGNLLEAERRFTLRWLATPR
jgi:hypothetical protein